MRAKTTLRWQLFAVFTAIAALDGCSCHVNRISQAKGAPKFENPSNDTGQVITDDQGKTTPAGSTDTLDFGPTLVNQDKPAQKTITVTNTGVADVVILDLTKADGFNSDVFKVPTKQQIGQTIHAGASGTFTVSFAPNAAGDFASDFTLVTDADDTISQPLTVHLKGSGVTNGCVLAPADKLDFGNVKVGGSYSKTLVVQNTTPIDYVFTYQGISGADADSFSTTLAAGPVTIKAHDSLSIPVTYTADHKGVAAAELQFESPADMCAPEPFDLRAQGVDSVLTATPDPVDFGFVDPGVTWGSVSQKVTIANIGNSALTLSDAALCDQAWGGAFGTCAATSEFASHADGSTGAEAFDVQLQPGASTQVTLYFKPARLHVAAGHVQLHVAGDPQQTDFGFDLKGTGGGPKIQVQPTSVDFGMVATGAPQSRNVFITNIGSSPSGQAGSSLVVTSIDKQLGANTTDAELALDPSVTFPITLAATQRKAVPIVFDPNGTGARSATFTVHSNDPVNPAVTVTVTADGEDLPNCNYAVSPATLNFGNVAAGRNRILSFRITNPGPNDCLLSDLDLSGDTQSPPYSLVDGPIVSQTLAAGASLDVSVKFAPVSEVATENGAVSFFMSSSSAPQGTVQLLGGSAQGCILITPDDLDYGVVQQGCASRDRTFTVYNVCTSSQKVTDIAFEADASGRCPGNASCPFHISGAPGLPATIAGGQSVTFKVTYEPTGVEQDAVELAVQTDGLTNPYIVTLEGHGDTSALQTDTYRQDAQPKVDVLLVVDDSASMEDKQIALGNNFQSFIQFAVNQQVDYHIGVTSTSTAADEFNDCTNTDPDEGSIAPCGRLAPNDGSRPRILTSATPNLEQLFAANVNVGDDGDGTEMGLEAAYEALSAPTVTGWNDGFLRDEANLAVIVVTDTADSSPSSYDFYKNFLLNIKGAQHANAFSFSAIVPTLPSPPDPNQCSYDSEAGQNTRYAQLAGETNGVVQEICTNDWASSLRQLGQSAFGYRTRFFLTETPDTSQPIVVKIDGTDYPATGGNGATRWTYNASANAIDFQPLAVPEPGSTLTITYSVLCYAASP